VGRIFGWLGGQGESECGFDQNEGGGDPRAHDLFSRFFG
jgi:hypothetical protein